jgi:Undecaprenyl-phosphate galactose phosphotransferase WbaP
MSASATAVAPLLATPYRYGNLKRWATFLSIIGTDLIVLILSGVIAFSLRSIMNGRLVVTDYLPFFPILPVFFLIFWLMGAYPGLADHPIREFRKILAGTSLSYLLIIGMTFFTKQPYYSRLLFILGWMLSVIFLAVGRSLTRSLCCHRPWWGIPTVIIGSGSVAQSILAKLNQQPSIGLRPVAVLGHGVIPQVIGQPGIAVGTLSQAPLFARRYSSAYAIVALPELSSGELSTIVHEYATGFPRIIVVPNLMGMASLWVTVKDLCGFLCLEVQQTLEDPLPQFTKRALDLFLGSLLFLLLAPLLLVLYLCVKCTSPGPVFYGQPRLGRNGKVFRAWKFRSMVNNADKILEQHLQANPILRAEWLKDHKLKNDPRITRIGKVLRKTSLDELPQLWNVLRGEMSFVGPRPIVEAEIEKYGLRYDFYKKVTPGITGLWQISGRNNTTYQERVELDRYYVQNWSVWNDLYIMFRTVKTVLCSEGAY